MKQFSSDKSSVAWFKLAEFIARGEKERALSIYRLLMHSIQSEAVRAQLEGDILHAFNDQSAIQAYMKAAVLYQKNNDPLQAVTLYELISQLAPDSYEHGRAMLTLYQQLSHTGKICSAAQHLVDLLMKRGQFTQAHDLIRDLDINPLEKASLHEQFVLGMLNDHATRDKALLMSHITWAVEGYMSGSRKKTTKVTQFLAKLAALDEEIHQIACQAMNDF